MAAALPEALLSLAGRTDNPAVTGRTRSGGFGGVDGLAEFLRTQQVSAVVDATHPFAATMHHHAARACADVGVALLRVERPSWGQHPEAAGWQWVASHAEAARAAARVGGPIFLTVGRQHTPDYVEILADSDVVARVADPTQVALPERWTVLRSRGPFALDDERALFAGHGFRCVVTKDAGGSHTDAKLTAAREAGAAVVMISRPEPEPGVQVVNSVEDALEWVHAVAS